MRDHLDILTKLNFRDVWTPNAENFFARVPGWHLEDLWNGFLGLPEDHPTVTTFAKLKKRDKAERLEELLVSAEVQERHALSPDQRTALAAWCPDGMN